MSPFRSLAASLLSGAVTFSVVTASGCGTDAVGIDDCRDIEQARCVAGKPCGLVDDVDACKRYYRDHCLHGLAVKPPAGSNPGDCVAVIEAAGRCATVDPESMLSDCGNVTADQPGLHTACDVVAHPERAAECSFLTQTPDTSSGGQPATSGEGGSPAEPEPAASGAAGQSAQGGASTE